MRLAGIRPGTAGWPAYEKYCEDLLSFLFVPPLNPPIPQSRDERHVNRRDYVLPNYATDFGFWQFMRTHYEAHLVVAEVKNMSRGPGKNEILQVANYLNQRGTGLFALILARTDLDQAARWTCREQWVHYNKLIVGLSDEDVVQMVTIKTGGGDPPSWCARRSRTSGWESSCAARMESQTPGVRWPTVTRPADNTDALLLLSASRMCVCGHPVYDQEPRCPLCACQEHQPRDTRVRDARPGRHGQM